MVDVRDAAQGTGEFRDDVEGKKPGMGDAVRWVPVASSSDVLGSWWSVRVSVDGWNSRRGFRSQVDGCPSKFSTTAWFG